MYAIVSAVPRSARDEAIIHMPPSYRPARHYSSFYLQLQIGLAFAVASPLLVAAQLAYFATAWVVWRYCQL